MNNNPERSQFAQDREDSEDSMIQTKDQQIARLRDALEKIAGVNIVSWWNGTEYVNVRDVAREVLAESPTTSHAAKTETEEKNRKGKRRVSTAENSLPCLPIACPFCEGTKNVVRTMASFNGSQYYVMCDTCKAHTRLVDSHEEAVEAWNRRPSTPPKKEAGICSECEGTGKVGELINGKVIVSPCPACKCKKCNGNGEYIKPFVGLKPCPDCVGNLHAESTKEPLEGVDKDALQEAIEFSEGKYPNFHNIFKECQKTIQTLEDELGTLRPAFPQAAATPPPTKEAKNQRGELTAEGGGMRCEGLNTEGK